MVSSINPVIHQLCERLRSNDASLTNLSFGTLALFQLSACDADRILQALLYNTMVTDLDLFLPTREHSTHGDDSGNNKYNSTSDDRNGENLLKRVLMRPNCSIRSVTLRHTSRWSDFCEALLHGKSIRRLEIGMASSFLCDDDPHAMKFDEWSMLIRSLSHCTVDSFTLRRFHLSAQSWCGLVEALKSTQKIELQQISTDGDFSSGLQILYRNTADLAIVECQSTSTDLQDHLRDPVPQSSRSSLAKLRMVHQSDNKQFFLASLGSLIRSPVKLVHLDLSGNGVDHDMAIILAAWMEKQLELERIILEDNLLSDASLDAILGALVEQSQLRELNVRRNRFTGVSMTVHRLAPLLQLLDLSENEGLGDSVWLSDLVRKNPQIQDWKLDFVGMTDRGLVKLCQIFLDHGNSSQLRLLDIHRNGFSSSGMTALSCILSSTSLSLKELNLACCRLDDDSVRVLAKGLEGNPCLVDLCLAFNAFGNPSCHILAKSASTAKQLRSLDIQFGKFDQDGLGCFLQTLQDNPCLDKLSYWSQGSFGRQVDDIEEQLEFWLNLNQAGRRVMKYPAPSHLFPFVLERAGRVSSSTLFYIVREVNTQFLSDGKIGK